MTFQRGNLPTSRRSGQRRDVPEDGNNQRRDVPEDGNNQRRDVGYQRREVPEGCKINVATLRSHVATFQRRVKLTSRHCDVATLQRRDVGYQRRDVTEKAQNVHLCNHGLR